MPATDWREITFSRAPLRPGDGRDTKVKDLYRECVTISKRIAVRPPGQDLAASASDLEEYAKAKDMVTEAEKRLSKNEGKLKQDEMTRQELERKNLNESLIMRKETFDAEWKHKRQEMEKHTRQKMQGNLDRADGQRMALELTLKKASKSQPKVKYSSTVRDERILENKHSAAFEFELASRFSKSLAGQKTQEQSNHAKGVQDGIEMKRERLELRLEREKEDMRDACERHRLAFELQLKNAEERQKQAERNLRADSEHALANEWGQRREVCAPGFGFSVCGASRNSGA
ncbi:hypothetical protein T484DRAFT_3523137 [Baffinella frigidus]|nr:hypothetical protein T484DRAFT_3523137 [Cryptophyta sp. CCMP2293]